MSTARSRSKPETIQVDLFKGNQRSYTLGSFFSAQNDVTLFKGDCLELLESIPSSSAQLVITSPPYNIGKEYEKKTDLDSYVAQQERVIQQCVRVLADRGNICWQIGNFVHKGTIVPLDLVLYPIFAKLGLQMRNRIVWHFEHGLHCSRRFSGRYEVVIWFTKTDDFYFDVDPVRIPQKYPGKKYFKGPKAGQYSCNPKGKNPGDVWILPNVKHNHVEKTLHPCQFPVELIERFVLSMTKPGDLVVDPFMGVGTTAVAALRHDRKSAGAEIVGEYHDLAIERVKREAFGNLPTRPMGREVYRPAEGDRITKNPFQKKLKY